MSTLNFGIKLTNSIGVSRSTVRVALQLLLCGLGSIPEAVEGKKKKKNTGHRQRGEEKEEDESPSLLPIL